MLFFFGVKSDILKGNDLFLLWAIEADAQALGLRLKEAYFEEAKIDREDNDISVQSQSERDITVADNEDGRERTLR